MEKVDRRRANISVLVRRARIEASLKGKEINTVDPLVICAKRLFPFLPEHKTSEYARTALRVIRNESVNQILLTSHQTTLLNHLV